ncbi:MAG: hypothetical protein KJZ84_09760 [Bryobacteraceae bacterium]|nr:hypothetical protein [Bryobacteraceae bacterium]
MQVNASNARLCLAVVTWMGGTVQAEVTVYRGAKSYTRQCRAFKISHQFKKMHVDLLVRE